MSEISETGTEKLKGADAPKSTARQSGDQLVKFTMPKSGIAGQSGPKEVELILPTDDIIDQALELAAHFEKRSQAVFMHQAQLNQLRLCLRSIGGEQVGFRALEGGGLREHVTDYEQSYLVKALERLTTPKDRDVEAFLDTMEFVG